MERCRSKHCDYVLDGRCRYEAIMGVARPCLGWPDCDFDPQRKGDTVKDYNGMDYKTSMNLREELWKKGANDAEIAEACGVGVAAIRRWREKRGYAEGDGRGFVAPEGTDAGSDPLSLSRGEAATAPSSEGADGLPVSDKPWDGEELDPYVCDGSMSPEDFEAFQAAALGAGDNPLSLSRCKAATAPSSEGAGEEKCLTVEGLLKVLVNAPLDSEVRCAECDSPTRWVNISVEYDAGGEKTSAVVYLGA